MRLGVVVGELLLKDAVGEASLLLLLQLRAVLALLDPRATVLAGRVGTALERRVATDEVHAETAGLAGSWGRCNGPFQVSLSTSQKGSNATALGRAAAVVRGRRDVLDGADLKADGTERTDRGLAARTRTLTKTSIFFMPWSMARRPAASAAI